MEKDPLNYFNNYLAPTILGLTFLLVIFVAVLNHQSQQYVTKEEYCQMIRLSLKPKYLPRDQIKLCYETLKPR